METPIFEGAPFSVHMLVTGVFAEQLHRPSGH